MAETTVDMSADDSKKEYIRALEQRDQRIDQLKTELENVTRLKNQELANLTQKMEFIMDEKDHQIKVNLINHQPDGLTVTVRAGSRLPKSSTMMIAAEMSTIAQKFLERLPLKFKEESFGATKFFQKIFFRRKFHRK